MQLQGFKCMIKFPEIAEGLCMRIAYGNWRFDSTNPPIFTCNAGIVGGTVKMAGLTAIDRNLFKKMCSKYLGLEHLILKIRNINNYIINPDNKILTNDYFSVKQALFELLDRLPSENVAYESIAIDKTFSDVSPEELWAFVYENKVEWNNIPRP